MPPNMTTNKGWIVPLVCILIVVAIVYIGHRSANEDERIDKTTDSTPIEEWPSVQVSKETIKESNKLYDITVNYPVTKSESITAYMSDFVKNEIEIFKQNVTGENELPDGYPSATLNISYEERKSENANTYLFVIYTDTGGAHGLTVTRTFSFAKNGERINIEDLFTNGAQGLGVIADYVKTELQKKEFADRNWIAEGAASTTENYKSFVIEDSGVTFIFDPYQVAAYAAGTQNVSVPTSVFKRIANPEIFN